MKKRSKNMNDNVAIDNYFSSKEIVHKLFGYKADWKEIPMDDLRGHYWMIVGGEGSGGMVCYYKEPLSKEIIESGVFYSGPIYTQRFLPKWVYRSLNGQHVMISVDTRVDLNKFLMIFDADKEVIDEELRALYKEHWNNL